MSPEEIRADTLRQWVEKGKFVWLVTPEILEEYKEVEKRLNVRPSVAGRLVNLLREEAEEVTVRKSVEISPIRATTAFVPALKKAGLISS